MTSETTIRAALEPFCDIAYCHPFALKDNDLVYIKVGDCRRAKGVLSALSRLVADRDAAEAKGWNEATEAVAQAIEGRLLLSDFPRDMETSRDAAQTARALRREPQPQEAQRVLRAGSEGGRE